jgi:hypothetical protein
MQDIEAANDEVVEVDDEGEGTELPSKAVLKHKKKAAASQTKPSKANNVIDLDLSCNTTLQYIATAERFKDNATCSNMPLQSRGASSHI